MRYGFILSIVIAVSGCGMDGVSRLSVGDSDVSIVPIALPYEFDYVFSLFGEKNPWNRELLLSDLGIVLPFGYVCALKELTRYGYMAMMHFSSTGIVVCWQDKELMTYEFDAGNPPKAVRMVIVDADKPGECTMILEDISLEEALESSAENDREDSAQEQTVVFCREGGLIKREGEDAFSLVERPPSNLKALHFERKVIKTQQDIVFLDWLVKHPYEVGIYFGCPEEGQSKHE